MQHKLEQWGVDYELINISENAGAKIDLKMAGHKTVPQLYFRHVHLNKVDTKDFELIDMFKEMMNAFEEDSAKAARYLVPRNESL
jgi:hypothetical protein